MYIDFDVTLEHDGKTTSILLPTPIKPTDSYKIMKEAFSEIGLDYDTVAKGDYTVKIHHIYGSSHIMDGAINIEPDTDIDDLDFTLQSIHDFNEDELMCFSSYLELVGSIDTFDELNETIDRVLKELIEFYPEMDMLHLAIKLVDDGEFGDIDERLIYHIDYEGVAIDLDEYYKETYWGVINREG